MGIFSRLKQGQAEVIETAEEKELYRDLGERMEMKSYISFDDVRKHLVEMIEKNKELREEVRNLREKRSEIYEDYRKRAELAQISADEYKSQLKEAEQQVKGLHMKLNKASSDLEKMERERNAAITELEMMKVKMEEVDKREAGSNKVVPMTSTKKKKGNMEGKLDEQN